MGGFRDFEEICRGVMPKHEFYWLKFRCVVVSNFYNIKFTILDFLEGRANIINRIRLWIIKRLIKDTDGYVNLGLVKGQPMNFYYDDNRKIYVLGKRCGNFYYTNLTLTGWHSYMSRYLHWSETMKEPRVVPFIEWIYGVSEQINKEYRERYEQDK